MARMAIGVMLAWLLLVAPALAAGEDIKIGVKGGMDAKLFAPDGPGPFPAVLVLHTSRGMQNADLAYAERLAKEGYVTLTPYFLAAYDISSGARSLSFTRDADAIFADFIDAIARLKTHPKVQGAKVGGVGFSNGGYWTGWLSGAGKIDAGVAYYGAFSAAGEDQQLQRFRGAFGPRSSPLLVMHGDADRTVPIGVARRLVALAKDAGSAIEAQWYPGAGHLFDRDSVQRSIADDSWARTTAFLARHLK